MFYETGVISGVGGERGVRMGVSVSFICEGRLFHWCDAMDGWMDGWNWFFCLKASTSRFTPVSSPVIAPALSFLPMLESNREWLIDGLASFPWCVVNRILDRVVGSGRGREVCRRRTRRKDGGVIDVGVYTMDLGKKAE